MLNLVTNSSLEKIFKASGPTLPESSCVMFQNEACRFQLAFYDESDLKDVSVKAVNDNFDIEVNYVRELKADRENLEGADDYTVLSPDKMYPEILTPKAPDICEGKIWHAFFICLKAKDGVKAGKYSIYLNVSVLGVEIAGIEYQVEILDEFLPDLDIPVTCWMHYDCIAYTHNLAPFEPGYYDIFEKYLELYVSRGHNMLLIPAFTPALDTAVGGERMLTQLVDVERNGDKYSFDFSRLDYFIDFIIERGIRYFEFAHLFTQWGAAACPKIIAKTENDTKRIFGWDTLSDGKDYLDFLAQYLPALTKYLVKKDIAEQSFIHLSDEPVQEHLDRYEKLYRYIKRFTGDIKTLDALSHFEFYERGSVDLPVVASDCVRPFLEADVKHFVYYCCCQRYKYVSNRFFVMPSERIAVIGVQMYLNGAAGFLHWGFNFYNTQYSTRPLNPYLDTASGGNFPSGDAFVVYPDFNGGVIPSIRLEVFHEGIQLYLALKKLESLIGKETTVGILKEHGYGGYEIYPHSPKALKILKKEILNYFKYKQ